jgi:hypothetical protein
LSSVEQRDMRYKRDLYNKESERPERRRSLRAQVLKGVGVSPPTRALPIGT